MHNAHAHFSYPFRLPPGTELKLGPEELKDWKKQTYDLKLIRGHFLDIIIGIEEKINLLIEKSMIAKNSKLKSVFREKILHFREMTLKTKIDLLCEIIKTKKEMKEEEIKEFHKSLSILITERNKWAHAPICFEQKKVNKKLKLQSHLEYINSKGKLADQELTDKYFDSLNEKLKIINNKLEKIMIKRKLIIKENKKKS